MQYHAANYDKNTWDVYWYEKNLQGDIVAVYNNSGIPLVSYEYDAWGNHTVSYTNGIYSAVAANNPFRYRGYYYDADLGFYYLNSRYYDSYTGRFLNADKHVNGNGDVIGYNMFAYCSNNPVMYTDSTGEGWPVVIFVVGLTVGLIYGMVVSSILDGLTEDDSYHNRVDSYDIDEDTVAENWYFDADVNEFHFGEYASDVTLTLGAYNEKTNVSSGNVSNFNAITASGTIGYFGIQGQMNLASYSVEHNFNLFGRDLILDIEFNIGWGANLKVGNEVSLGASNGFGMTLSLRSKKG